jgi:hypothetical protein
MIGQRRLDPNAAIQPKCLHPQIVSLQWRIVRAQKLNEGSHFASKSCNRVAERIAPLLYLLKSHNGFCSDGFANLSTAGSIEDPMDTKINATDLVLFDCSK